MTPSLPLCVVCSKPTAFFNYGVHSCNGCVLFFRRIMACLNAKRECKNGGACTDLQVRRCKKCRFLKCLEVGMSHVSSKNMISPVSYQKHDELSIVINGLVNLDMQRNTFFLQYEALKDPTIDELIMDSGSVEFVKKLENQKMSIYDWGFCQQVTTIRFLKDFLEYPQKRSVMSLEEPKKLSPDDLKIIIKATFFKTSILYNAFRSFLGNHAKMVFPDGSDVMPEELHALCPKLLNDIRCRLIGKFVELRINKEEFLMLIVLFLLVNPATTDLSEDGKNILDSHRNIFTSALLKYCQINYQQAGLSRFTDLLSVCQVANNTLEDFHSLAMLTMFGGPVTLPKKIFAAN